MTSKMELFRAITEFAQDPQSEQKKSEVSVKYRKCAEYADKILEITKMKNIIQCLLIEKESIDANSGVTFFQ